MKRLFIVDPSLKDMRGHHYALTRAATQSAQALGFDVCWLCSAEYDGALSLNNVSIEPAFGETMYAQYMMPAADKSGSRWVGRFMEKLFPAKQTQPPKRENAFLDDLKAALARHDANSEDRVFIHTADGVVFRALAPLLLEDNGVNTPRMHVATPYNPTGIMPNKGAPEEIDSAIAALKEAGLIGSRLFLYGENKTLADHLSAHWRVAVQPLDLPVRPPDAAMVAAAQHYRRNELKLGDEDFLLISLGAARLEKGFDLFPEIIRHALAMHAERNATAANATRIKFLLHATPQIIGRVPEIAAAIEALGAFPKENVELILEPLSDEDYQKILYASDAVVMPYRKKDYAVRGSMIVSEAIVAAKPIIGTANTYPGEAALGAGGCAADTPQEFAEAVISMMGERKESENRARAAAATYTEKNAVDLYWRKCLEAEAAAQ